MESQGNFFLAQGGKTKSSCFIRTKPRKEFIRQAALREVHMERYQRGEMGRSDYLKKMGSVTLKATHAMGKTCLVVCEDKIKSFLAFFEESMYDQGHFQSVDPISDSQTLRMIRDSCGFDVASFLGLPDGKFYSVLLIPL